MEFGFKLLKKLRDTGTVDRRPGSGRPRSARIEENVEAVNDLVSSQECKLQTDRTVCLWGTTGDEYSSVHSKCNLFAFSSISAEYLQKIWIFNFPRQCSNMPKVRWVLSYGFCSKFHMLSSSAKLWKSVKIWQSYRQFKVGNFLRYSVFELDDECNIIKTKRLWSLCSWLPAWLGGQEGDWVRLRKGGRFSAISRNKCRKLQLANLTVNQLRLTSSVVEFDSRVTDLGVKAVLLTHCSILPSFIGIV